MRQRRPGQVLARIELTLGGGAALPKCNNSLRWVSLLCLLCTRYAACGKAHLSAVRKISLLTFVLVQQVRIALQCQWVNGYSISVTMFTRNQSDCAFG